MTKPTYRELMEKAQLSESEIESLVTDPVIRECLIQLKMDVLISGWVVKGSSNDVALFCRHILSRIWVELAMTMLNAIAKGTQVCEVSWDIEDVRVLGRNYPASVVPKHFYTLPKRSIKFLWDEEQRAIVGVTYQSPKGPIRLTDEKVIWYSFSPTDRSWPFGVSILEKVRPMHEMFSDAMDLLGAYVENLTMPPIIGYAPPGEIRDYRTGEVVDGLEYLMNRLKELRSEGIGVFPTDLTPEGQPKWRVDFQTGATPAGSVEIARILEIVRQFKKEAIYSPNQQQSTMVTGQIPAGLPGYILRELLDSFNKQIVKHLVYLNWGPEEWAYVEPADQAADIGLVRDIVRSSIQFSDADRQRILKLLDWYALLQMFGLPLAMEEEEEEEEQPQQAQTLPGLGGFGGMPLGGLTMPQSIQLPEGLELPTTLPEIQPPVEVTEEVPEEVQPKTMSEDVKRAMRAAIQGP